MATGADRVIRRADVLWRATLHGVLVRPLGAREVVRLGGTGAALWALLDEPISFPDLCAALARDHDADAVAIAHDLEPVLVDLGERGVIVVGR